MNALFYNIRTDFEGTESILVGVSEDIDTLRDIQQTIERNLPFVKDRTKQLMEYIEGNPYFAGEDGGAKVKEKLLEIYEEFPTFGCEPTFVDWDLSIEETTVFNNEVA